MTHDPDWSFIQAVAAGNTQALDELYQRHGLHLLNYLLGQLHDRQVAEDVLQNVMLIVWRKAGDFRGESSVRTWMFSIARRQMLRTREKNAKYTTPPDDILDDSDPRKLTDRIALDDALQNLSFDQRQALELIFYRGLRIDEAATLLDIPPGTLKSRIHRAKANLRKMLLEDE